jgi:hypothetical protein
MSCQSLAGELHVGMFFADNLGLLGNNVEIILPNCSLSENMRLTNVMESHVIYRLIIDCCLFSAF